MEKRYFHKDGHIVWILLSVSLVRDEARQPMYFVSQIQDITARKHAEIELIDSEFRYRTIANLVPGFVFEGVVRDGRPQPTWVSSGFERVYGCTLAAQFNKAIESTAVHPLKAAAHPGRLRAPIPYHSLKHEARHEIGDGPIAKLTVDQVNLLVLPSCNVLDLRNEIHRLTCLVAHQRDG